MSEAVKALLRPEESLVLVGLMGAGKSLIGRRLAQALDREFLDADSEIEAAAGLKVTEIFASLGEAAFRDGERRVIARLLAEQPGVMATGGGAFMDPRTRAEVRAHGISIWLKADLSLLIKRTARRSHRPLLNCDDPGAVLARLQRERHPVYAAADITVESLDAPPEETLAVVLAALESFLTRRSAVAAAARKDEHASRHA